MLSFPTFRGDRRSPAELALSLGRTARQIYDRVTGTSDQIEGHGMVARELDRQARFAGRRNVSSQPSMPADGRGGGRRGRGPEGRSVNGPDLRLMAPNMYRIPRVPRSISQAVVWDVFKARVTISLSTSAIVEQNFSTSLSAHPQLTSWIALFDQFCIPQFSVTFYNTQGPGSGNSTPIGHTAIDFDNIANLGSLSAIDDYASCIVKDFPVGTQFTRSVRPCVKSTVNATSSASVERLWLDCQTANTVAHTGIRSIWEIVAGSSPAILTVEVTTWLAFRNAI